MLVLSRKAEEKILIGEDIVITIVRIAGVTVRVGIEAPKHVLVRRGELAPLAPPAASMRDHVQRTKDRHE